MISNHTPKLLRVEDMRSKAAHALIHYRRYRATPEDGLARQWLECYRLWKRQIRSAVESEMAEATTPLWMQALWGFGLQRKVGRTGWLGTPLFPPTDRERVAS